MSYLMDLLVEKLADSGNISKKPVIKMEKIRNFFKSNNAPNKTLNKIRKEDRPTFDDTNRSFPTPPPPPKGTGVTLGI